jgi:hypothetical protein
MAQVSEKFCDWAATKLLEDVREGVLPGSISLEDIIWNPFLDSIRKQTREEDREAIVKLLKISDYSAWGLILSRGLSQDDEITNELRSLFESSPDRITKLSAFHELSYRKVSENLRDVLGDFLIHNLSLFMEEELRYFGSSDVIIDRCHERMCDAKFINKRWVYLFTVHCSDDIEAAKTFVRQYLNDKDPFVCKMAQKSLSLLETGK